MRAPCPSMFASIRMTGTVLLRRKVLPFLLEPGDALGGAQVLLAFRENSAPCVLRLHALFMKLLSPAVFFNQLLMMLLDVGEDGSKFLVRQARHGAVDEFEVV